MRRLSPAGCQTILNCKAADQLSFRVYGVGFQVKSDSVVEYVGMGVDVGMLRFRLEGVGSQRLFRELRCSNAAVEYLTQNVIWNLFNALLSIQ